MFGLLLWFHVNLSASEKTEAIFGVLSKKATPGKKVFDQPVTGRH